MGAILGFFGSKLAGYVGIALAGLAVTLAMLLWLQTSRVEAARVAKALIEVDLAGTKARLERSEADLVLHQDIAFEQSKALGKLSGVTHEIRTEIREAPPSAACASSPAVRALLDGVRKQQAADRAAVGPKARP